MFDRQLGLNIIRTVLKNETNIKIFEACVFNIATDTNGIYNDILYDVIGIILTEPTMASALNIVKSRQFGWDSVLFSDIKNRLKEQDEFIINPFEVEEGVIDCKCGSKRVFSYSKQVRSCDEPVTTFAQCMSCKSKWKCNN